jgi:hypothetical protein
MVPSGSPSGGSSVDLPPHDFIIKTSDFIIILRLLTSMIQWSKGNEQVLKRLCREQRGKHRAVSLRSQTNLAYPRSRLGTIGFGLCSLANES